MPDYSSSHCSRSDDAHAHTGGNGPDQRVDGVAGAVRPRPPTPRRSRPRPWRGGIVGLFAAQLAHLHGAHVTGTAGGQDTAFARQLGIAQVIDYHTTRFEDVLTEPFDIVFDTVGDDMLVRSLPLVKPGRFAITVSAANENSTDERIRDAFFIVEPNQRQLMEVAALIDTYKLRTWVKAAFPLAQANKAYTTIPGHGKVVVAVDPRTV